MSLPGRLSRVHPVLPFRPRLPLPSAAGTVTAHGSAPRTRPSELPPLTWSLELLRRWEVRDTRLQQPASLGSGPVYLWLPGLSSSFSPPDRSVCLPELSPCLRCMSFESLCGSSSGSCLSSLSFSSLALSSVCFLVPALGCSLSQCPALLGVRGRERIPRHSVS